MIAAEVLGIRCPTCAVCRDSASPCLLGCDSLPAEITVRPEGRGDTYIYLANHDVLGDVVRALSDANTRVLLSPDEARALVSRSMLDELDRQDVTHHQPCSACNAETGEPCRPGCIGQAAHTQEEE